MGRHARQSSQFCESTQLLTTAEFNTSTTKHCCLADFTFFWNIVKPCQLKCKDRYRKCALCCLPGSSFVAVDCAALHGDHSMLAQRCAVIPGKMASRLRMFGTNYAKLHEFVPPEVLPPEFGGFNQISFDACLDSMEVRRSTRHECAPSQSRRLRIPCGTCCTRLPPCLAAAGEIDGYDRWLRSPVQRRGPNGGAAARGSEPK